MSETFYIAVVGAIGAFFAVVPTIILAWATLMKVRKLSDDTHELKAEMNGHMTKVLEVTAAKGHAEGELKGRSDKTAEVLDAKTRAEDREDAMAYREQLNTVDPDWRVPKAAGKPPEPVHTSAQTVADAQKTAKDAQAVAKGAQTVAKNLTEEAK